MPILRGMPHRAFVRHVLARRTFSLARCGPDAADGEAAISPAFTVTVACALEGLVAVTVTFQSPFGSGSAAW